MKKRNQNQKLIKFKILFFYYYSNIYLIKQMNPNEPEDLTMFD